MLTQIIFLVINISFGPVTAKRTVFSQMQIKSSHLKI
jgi:hypothetical protein